MRGIREAHKMGNRNNNRERSWNHLSKKGFRHKETDRMAKEEENGIILRGTEECEIASTLERKLK
jgi:hypothetical protein